MQLATIKQSDEKPEKGLPKAWRKEPRGAQKTQLAGRIPSEGILGPERCRFGGT